MSRLFISHSSVDNVYALAFQNWLVRSGWGAEDIFIDLHDIGAGHRWRDTLRKANHACEAVIFLASTDALNSGECQTEVQLAEALGKEVIVALLRDIAMNDPRLARFSDRQFVSLSTFPQDHVEALTWDGREHRVHFNVEALTRIKARLEELGIAPETFPWPPRGVRDPEPYPGLSAFTEDDAGIFFGRDVEIMKALNDIRLVRKRQSPRLIVIDAASGAGKSSFLRAGLWPRLRRDNDFATLAVLRPAQGILSGPDGLGRKIATWFESLGKPRAPGSIHASLLAEDEDVAIRGFRSLFAEAVDVVTSMRRSTDPDPGARVPAPMIAIDQGEELFAPENAVESRRFLRLLANLLNDPPENVDPYAIVTIRADSKEALLGRVAELSMEPPDPNYLPPLSAAAYREVILRPAEVYSARVRRVTVDPTLVNALVEDAKGGDALPLMAFTLSRMFADFKAEGALTHAQYLETGGIAGSIGRALRQAQVRAGTGGSDAHLRRLLLPGLATWDPDANAGAGAAKRLVAPLSEIVGGPRSDLAPLADALVEARLLTRGRDTLEVAHEALLRIPPLEDWLLADRDFLAWRDRLGKARAAYEANIRGPLVGRELEIARTQLSQRSEADDISEVDRQFILKSIAEEDKRRTIEEERERKQQEAELAAAKAREEAAEAARIASEAKAAAEQEKAAAVAAELTAAMAREEAAEAARVATEAKATAEQEKAAAAAAAADLQLQSARRLARRTLAAASAVSLLTLLAVGLGIYTLFQQQARQLRDSQALTDTAEELRVAGAATNALKQAYNALPHGEQALLPFFERPIYPRALKVLKEARYERRELMVLRASRARLTAVAFSSDGELVATGSADNTVRILRSSDGSLVGTYDVKHEPDGEAQFTQATAVFDSEEADGRNTPYVVTLAFSPDGKRLVGGSTIGTVYVWDVGTEAPRASLTRHTSPVTVVTFDASGKRILTAARDSSAFIWEPEAGDPASGVWTEKVEIYPEPEPRPDGNDVPRAVTDAAFDPSGGRILLGFENGSAEIWDLAAAKPTASLPKHNDPISAVAFSPDGRRLLTASHDRTVEIFDAQSAAFVQRLVGHQDKIYDASFSPDGSMVVTASSDRSMRLWEVGSGSELVTIRGHEEGVFSAAFSQNGETILTGSDDGTARLWNARRAIEVTTIDNSAREYTAMHFSTDGSEVIATAEEGSRSIWNRATDRILKAPLVPFAQTAEKTFNDQVVEAVFSTDASFVVSRLRNGSVMLRRRDARESLHVMSGISALALSPDQRHILLGANGGEVLLWDIETRALVPAWRRACEQHKDGLCAEKHEYAVTAVRFSPSGEWAVSTGHDNYAKFWSVKSGQQLASINLASVPYCVVIRPKGDQIAFGLDNGTIRRLEYPSMAPSALVKDQPAGDLHSKRVLSLTYSGDGSTLLSASEDTTARVWDAKNGLNLAVLRGHRGDVISASFSPDEKSILTASTDRTVRIWPHWTDVKALIQDTDELRKKLGLK